jgi:hypothetical protein
MIRSLVLVCFVGLSLEAWAGPAADKVPTNANDPCTNGCIQELMTCMKGCGMEPSKPPKDPKSADMPCLKKCSNAQRACQRKCK